MISACSPVTFTKLFCNLWVCFNLYWFATWECSIKWIKTLNRRVVNRVKKEQLVLHTFCYGTGCLFLSKCDVEKWKPNGFGSMFWCTNNALSPRMSWHYLSLKNIQILNNGSNQTRPTCIHSGVKTYIYLLKMITYFTHNHKKSRLEVPR